MLATRTVTAETMTIPEVHLVAGGLPEAVRLAPVATALSAAGLLRPVLIDCGANRDVPGVLGAYGLVPELSLPYAEGDLAGPTGSLDDVWAARMPAAVLVAGDSTTGLAAAMAASWRHIPVVHLDAGRRSADLDAHEPDRHLLAQLASMHLVTSPYAALNLLDERVPAADILITGSTMVDAAVIARRGVPRAGGREQRILVVTRERHADRVARVLDAIRRLVRAYPGVRVTVSGHPAGRARTAARLAGVERITLAHELPFRRLVRLLGEAAVVLTDPGGIEEMAPAFGVPALVLDDPTTTVIVREVSRLLDSPVRRDAMVAAGNPYGDGHAAVRVAQATAAVLGLAERPEPMPGPARSLRPAVS